MELGRAWPAPAKAHQDQQDFALGHVCLDSGSLESWNPDPGRTGSGGSDRVLLRHDAELRMCDMAVVTMHWDNAFTCHRMPQVGCLLTVQQLL